MGRPEQIHEYGIRDPEVAYIDRSYPGAMAELDHEEGLQKGRDFHNKLKRGATLIGAPLAIIGAGVAAFLLAGGKDHDATPNDRTPIAVANVPAPEVDMPTTTDSLELNIINHEPITVFDGRITQVRADGLERIIERPICDEHLDPTTNQFFHFYTATEDLNGHIDIVEIPFDPDTMNLQPYSKPDGGDSILSTIEGVFVEGIVMGTSASAQPFHMAIPSSENGFAVVGYDSILVPERTNGPRPSIPSLPQSEKLSAAAALGINFF